MDAWRRGRGAIFNTLADLCDKIEDELVPELEKTSRSGLLGITNQELETLRARSSEADRLEAEVSELRARLAPRNAATEGNISPNAGLPKSGETSTPASTLASVITPRPLNKHHPPDANAEYWKREAATNGAKYNRISTELQKAKDVLVRFREERDGWKHCAEKWETKFKSLEAKLRKPADTSDSSTICPPVSRETGLSRITAVPRHVENTAGDETSSSATGSNERRCPSSPPAIPHAHGNPVTGPKDVSVNVDNQGDIAVELPPLPAVGEAAVTPATIKQEPSSDAPVVVSERVLRKRKLDDIYTREAEVRRVKREPAASSSPLVVGNRCDFSPAESVDLDEADTRLETPRKHDRFSVAGFAEGPVPLSILRDRDPNARGRKSVQDHSGTPIKRGISRGLASLAEDGEVYKIKSSNRKDARPDAAKSSFGLLKELLGGTTVPEESPVIRYVSKNANRHGRYEPPSSLGLSGLPLVQPRELPFDSKPVRKNGQQPVFMGISKGGNGLPHDGSTPKWTRKCGQDTTPRSPLRCKPLSALRLDDFKVNTSLNNGYQHPHAEVVRGEDERAKLPGCIDPGCCGPFFRTLALAERGNSPRTSKQQQEDNLVLERYLGDAAYRLFSMTKEEKDELWLVAKTKEIADRSGRCRQRFPRMRSPPGFWRTDFPNTQEIAKEKEEGQRRERDVIHDRYREAMRPDGRWRFRDEE